MTDTKALELARRHFLEPADISDTKLSSVCASLTGSKIDDSDIYFEYKSSESWVIEDGIVKEGSFDISKGVGVRVVSEEKSGFAHSDEILLPNIINAGKAARNIVAGGQTKSIQLKHSSTKIDLYDDANPLTVMSAPQKIEILKSIDTLARQQDTRVKQVIASLSGSYQIVLLANINGTIQADIRPLVRMNISVVVEQDGRSDIGSYGAGGRFDYRQLLDMYDIKECVNKALDSALINLHAVPAPAGEMVVVLGPGWPGVLLHEAIGHGLEGDFCRKGTSAFAGRIGEKVASEGITIVDDGTLPQRRGSLTIDDEGTSTNCTTLIEDGVLKGYMQDKMNARLMGVAPTGNGRRESYAHLPMPRMTNTYMLAGKYSPEEIIKSVDHGVYAVNFGGGQVDITSGKFVFSANEAYMIEKGKVGKPVKGMSLVGNGPDVLTRVSMVGNDLKLDDGVGTCGKNGQLVPVGVGQPTLRVDGITVGGTGE